MKMKTIILPGYSFHNKDWAYNIAKVLTENGQPTIVHEWRHWVFGGRFSLEHELEKLIDNISQERVNIIAKSVGTSVVMHLIKIIHKQINKLILCGIPGIHRIEIVRFNLYKNSMNMLLPEDMLVIQNENDPFGSFEKVEKFIHKVNSNIKTVAKPRSDHEYPYPTDFMRFLS